MNKNHLPLLLFSFFLRRHDGACNNVEMPYWGAANRAFQVNPTLHLVLVVVDINDQFFLRLFETEPPWSRDALEVGTRKGR